MDSCSGGQVGGVCAVGARLQGGEGLQGVAPGGDGPQPGGRCLCLDCALPAQLLPQVSEKRNPKENTKKKATPSGVNLMNLLSNIPGCPGPK